MANVLIEEIKTEDLWKYFKASGCLTAIHEIVKRSNLEREKQMKGGKEQ